MAGGERKMENPRQMGIKWILPAACLGFAGVAHAACTGAQTMVAMLRAHPTTENAVLLGSWYAGHQQFACAVDTFHAALKTDPESAQLHYLEGLALIGEGKTADGLPEIKESIRLQPQVIKPHLLLASLQAQAGHHQEAEEQWRQVLAIDPVNIPALEGLSNDLLARRDFAAVIALLGKAPRTERLAINLSRALGTLDYLDDAAKVLSEAMELSPRSINLANAMTVVLVKHRQYGLAIDLLQVTADEHPNDIGAQVELLRILVVTNHFDRARPLAAKLLPLRPHDPQVLYLCGTVDHAVGDNDKAKAHLEEAVALEPNFFNSRYNLGMVLALLHEWKEAKENLEKAIELDMPGPEVHFELATVLHSLGENDRANQEMQLFQQIKKSDEIALEAGSASAQGDKDLRDGKIHDAVSHYREATETAPTVAAYKFKLSVALDQAGDLAGERAQLEEAVRLDPKLAGAQNSLGYLLSRTGDVDGAVEHLRMAVEAAPAWTEAWINLAAELAVASRFPEARAAVAKALALDPGNAQARELSDQLARDEAAKSAQQ
jgi:tetratricopeptide (TPR) repeat protein